MSRPASDDPAWCPVVLTGGVEEPASVQTQVGELTGDRPHRDHSAFAMEFEREAEVAIAAPPVHPFGGALAGDRHLGGDVGDRTVLAALDEAALDRQWGVTVEHGRVFRSSGRRIGVFHPPPEDLSPSAHPCAGVTNVMTRNN